MSKSAPHTREKELLHCHADKLETLSNIVCGGNIPHAFLFSGTKGIGKSTAAYNFAKMVLSIGQQETTEQDTNAEAEIDLFGAPTPSPKKEENNVINKHVAEKVASGNHLDLLVLKTKEDEKSISVDEVRDIGRFLSLTPAEGKYRVAIIDSIDDFTIQASNAILKILEEPTRNTVLIIICHSKLNLLPTIKSRCMELKYTPLSKKDFLLVLSDLGYTEKNLEDVYALSYGSPGLAFEILEKNVNTLLDKYKKIISNKTVNITEITSLAKEIKDKDAWKIFGSLFLNYYSNVIKSNPINKESLDNFDKISNVIYLSEARNMDIQDSLKFITNYIKSN